MPDPSPVPHLFIFGLGFSGLAFARQQQAKGWRISGTTRSLDKKQRLESEEGFTMHLFDRGRPLDDASRALGGVTHVVISVPPDDQGDAVLDHHGVDLTRNIEWMAYLSTTGVYGNTDGREVTEQSPLNPTAKRSVRRVAAEQGWLDLAERQSLPIHLFRLAGIYGPGRSTVDQVRAGRTRRVEKPGHKFSRIHVADIAGILAASINHPNPGAAYNVCDDEAESPSEVVAYVCDLLGLAVPPAIAFEDAKKDMSPMGLSFWSDNRRVSNQRVKDDLGYKFIYPSYREGLSAIAKGATTGAA